MDLTSPNEYYRKSEMKRAGKNKRKAGRNKTNFTQKARFKQPVDKHSTKRPLKGCKYRQTLTTNPKGLVASFGDRQISFSSRAKYNLPDMVVRRNNNKKGKRGNFFKGNVRAWKKKNIEPCPYNGCDCRGLKEGDR